MQTTILRGQKKEKKRKEKKSSTKTYHGSIELNGNPTYWAFTNGLDTYQARVYDHAAIHPPHCLLKTEGLFLAIYALEVWKVKVKCENKKGDT